MLSREETLRRLKAVRHSAISGRIHGKALSMTEIARSTGIPRQYLHEIATGKSPLGAKTHPLLSDFFDCQENGGERAAVCPVPDAAFSNGNGGFSLNFGSKMPRKATR